MKVLDNIGLCLFLFSIVSMVFWSPSYFSISHELNDAMHKVSEKEHFFVEKSKIIPFKTNFVPDNTIGRTKIDIEDSKDFYSNSLTRTNEQNVKPTLNEISNWVGVNQDSSIIQKYLNKPDEKAYEVNVASKEIQKRDLDASYITSNDLKDHAHEVFEKSKLLATSAIEKANDWVADRAHEVFDESSFVADVAENEVDKIINTTFQEMKMKENLKFMNNSVSNIVESSRENICHEDLNENNALYNNLQFFGKKNLEDDSKNTTNIVHSNPRVLGVDNSNDFITESGHDNPQKLGERWNQMSKDREFNLIKQSSTWVNNSWSTYVDDAKVNEGKNELNPQKELHSSLNDQKGIYNQNENFDEDQRKHHREVSSQQYKHFEGAYNEGDYDESNYDDDEGDYDDEGVKQRIVKYSHRTYKDHAKVGANDDYEARKYIHRTRNQVHHQYRDARHRASEFYKPMKGATMNFRKNDKYNEYDGDDDEDFYDEL